jgi:hypothetical protein
VQNLDNRRADDHQQHCRQNEKNQRKQNLDRGPLRGFLRAQAPARAQGVGTRMQRRSDLRTELLALD